MASRPKFLSRMRETMVHDYRNRPIDAACLTAGFIAEIVRQVALP